MILFFAVASRVPWACKHGARMKGLCTWAPQTTDTLAGRANYVLEYLGKPRDLL